MSDKIENWKEDAKSALTWFIEVMGREEWYRRRKNVVDYFKETQDTVMLGIPKDPNVITPIAFYGDWMAWYMYLVESIHQRPSCDDPMQSNRIFPFFATIGRNIEALKATEGILPRIKSILNERQNHPDSTLFELAVAVLYIRNGWTVEFLTEKRDTKTPDIRATRADKSYLVECKRLAKTTSYSERERTAWQKKFQALASAMKHFKEPVYVDVVFKVPIDEVADDFLVTLFLNYRSLGYLKTFQKIFTPEVEFRAKSLDLADINRKLKESPTKPNSPKMIEVVTGQYDMHCGYNMIVPPHEVNFVHSDDDLAVLNVYYESVHFAYAVSWDCIAEKSIDLKAKDLKKILGEAIKQFPDGETGIVHFGYETVDGPLVEIKREQKITEVVREFDFRTKKVDGIYCNAMQFMPKTEGFEWAETTIYFESDASTLLTKLLIDTSGTETGGSTHWHEDAARRL